MSSLWHAHEFDESALQFWTFELLEAALALPLDKRDAFLAAACDGSDVLRQRVATSLKYAVEDGTPLQSGVCHPGDVVCDCLILRHVGRGGAGEVYKAIQRPLRRLVAVKVLLSVSHNERLAFEREAASIAQLNDEHVVQVYDADFAASQPSVVMEYVPGPTLRHWLEEQRTTDSWRPDVPVILSIAQQVCRALAAAHTRGIVHGDIKPENVLLSGTGNERSAKVTDFGLARHVDLPQGELAGTAGYMAPEQLTDGICDARVDIFSVGVVLYEMFVGRHPFSGRSTADTLANTVTREPEFPESADVPARYRAMTLKALQKEPSARYGSVTELLADLSGSAAGLEETTDANPFTSEFPQAAARWLQRPGAGLWIAALSSIWGCLSIVLSAIAGAACTRVTWSDGAGRAFEIVYGYAVEPNAGPWYAIGASMTVAAGFFLLQAAHMGLARTAALKAVRHPETSPIAHIAAINRRYFRVISPIILVGSVAFVFIPEVIFRHSNAFGWVQADLAPQFIGVHETALVQAGQTTALDSIRNQCPGCDLRVERVANRASGFVPPPPLWFGLFLTSALTHEMVFSAFMLFIAAKFLFFFVLLSRALLADHGADIRLVPDLDDRQDARFGLGRLDSVYLSALTFLLICAFGRLTQVAANLHKGTNFFRGNAALALVGQPLVASAVAIALVIVVLVPLGVFALLTIRILDRERSRLAVLQRLCQTRLSEARFPEARARVQMELEDLNDRRRVIDRQKLLPTDRPIFWWLLASTILLLVVGPMLIDTSTATALIANLNERICAACGNPPLR
jgi:serine/threonine-protein kinase